LKPPQSCIWFLRCNFVKCIVCRCKQNAKKRHELKKRH
jgi:hypothetical protein